MMELMSLLILVVGEFRGGLSTQGGIFLVFVLGGVLLSLFCIVSFLLFLGLWLIMMMVQVLFLILLSGLLVVLPRGGGLQCGIGLFFPGPPDLVGAWISVAATPISCRDIEVWPFSVGMLVKWVSFLSSLHWPAGGSDRGVGGVSYVELLILYELWAGERLELEKAFLDTAGLVAQFQCRLFLLVQALIFGVQVGFLGLCFEVFGTCRSGFGVLFLVILVLITVGFGTLGGSGVRPRESSSVDFLDKLLVLFGYPDGSAAALLAGVLPLRYCSARFAWKLPTWRLPDRGRVRDLVADCVDDAQFLGCDRLGGICFLLLLVVLVILLMIWFWWSLKEFDSTEKHQHTLLDLGTLRVFSLIPRFGRDCGFLGAHWCSACDSHVLHIVVLDLLWVTGLLLDSLRMRWSTSPGYEGGSN